MSWPKVAPAPAPDDVVQVLMTETMARELERAMDVELSPPLMFADDDVPSYIVRP